MSDRTKGINLRIASKKLLHFSHFRCPNFSEILSRYIHHIRTLKSRPGGRVEILLETGEKLMASRHYAPLLRERLGL